MPGEASARIVWEKSVTLGEWRYTARVFSQLEPKKWNYDVVRGPVGDVAQRAILTSGHAESRRAAKDIAWELVGKAAAIEQSKRRIG